MRHAQGGVWDEWYAAFDDNRWGWLAEAQGRFYMSFEQKVEHLPPFENLTIGEAVPKLATPLVVAEKGTAHYASADGEIPYALVPNSELTYADLSGINGVFATLDYSDDKPVLYAGKEVTLKDLALDAGGAQLKPEKKVAITNLGCPKCGGSLELRAPDSTERIGCPYCGSLIDCTQGKFTLLQALSSKLEKPLIPLGSEAEFEGVKQIVIGFVKRSCIVEGAKYFWKEYLLYNKALGFRWLVHSDNHWTYVRPLQTAQVKIGPKYATYNGQSFKRFQDAPASIEMVLGEFYWKVAVGETVQTSDFVCPPLMLSSERTTYAATGDAKASGGEIAWSLGEYVAPEEIKSKFKLQGIPLPTTVGACQPNPHLGWGKLWALGVAAVFVLLIAMMMIRPDRTLVDQEIAFPAQPAVKVSVSTNPGTSTTPATPGPETPPPDAGAVWVSEPFDVNPRQKIAITAKTKLNNSWMALEGALIDETKGEVLPFDVNIEYWSGSDEDGSWSEGNQDGYMYIPAQPAGKYVLRIEGHWEHMTSPSSFHLVVEQTAIDPVFLFLTLLGVSLLPIFKIIAKFMFESGRWNESMYGPKSSDD